MVSAADDQAISSRFGDSIWITDFITPRNPDVQLLHERLTEGLKSPEERIISLWRYVAEIPYRESIATKLVIDGKSYKQSDTWLYPTETIRLAPYANCVNKSFLLVSLLRNELPETRVFCCMGHVSIDGIGAHAWVEYETRLGRLLLEPTQPNLEKALIPTKLATAYDPVLCFNDKKVYNTPDQGSLPAILNERFGFCAIPFLGDYLCKRCADLEH